MSDDYTVYRAGDALLLVKVLPKFFYKKSAESKVETTRAFRAHGHTT